LSGLDKLPSASRRGLAIGDVNNDGKLDVLLLNIGEPPTLLINRSRNDNHAVMFRLVGSKSNRAAIGARVTLSAGGAKQIREVRSGSSYLSQNDLRLHFGLGTEASASSVEILWPSGKEEIYKDVPSDFIYTIVEGSGITERSPFTGKESASTKPTSTSEPAPRH
jgi:hypothetical protein